MTGQKTVHLGKPCSIFSQANVSQLMVTAKFHSHNGFDPHALAALYEIIDPGYRIYVGQCHGLYATGGSTADQFR
jgi:hypothetical protein